MAAKCGACGKFISPPSAASCTGCPLVYHRGCVSITDATVLSRNWTCPECKRKIRKGDNSSTSVRGVSGIQAHFSVVSDERTPPPNPTMLPATLSPGPVEIDVRELRAELAECMSEIRDFRREMSELRAFATRFSERLEGLEKRIEVLEQRPQESGLKEISELERTVTTLKLELNDREQEVLSSDIEIGNLPEEKNDNTARAVIVLAAKLGVSIDERDIVFAERVGGPGPVRGAEPGAASRERRVVVRLTRRATRDSLIQAARVRRTLTAADTGGPTTDTRRIFVNERLTRQNRQLFYRLREECRKHQWRYSWTRRGRLFTRQGDGKPVHQIRCEADLKRVFPNDTVAHTA